MRKSDRGEVRDSAHVSEQRRGEIKSAISSSWTSPSIANPSFTTSSVAFNVEHATGIRVLKGEDVMFVKALDLPAYPQSMMYMVLDGHSGVECAEFVAEHCHRLISDGLNSPPTKATDFAENVRRVISETFVRIDNEWMGMEHLAGTTVTLVLITGGLLTTANIGDSSAVLDTGCSLLELTHSHRLQENHAERRRLAAAGGTIAQLGFHLQGPAKPNQPGVGPIRLWPGGLCVSRSIGDIDAGPEVVPLPHVKQLVLPPAGCRIIMASDGLWDVLTLSKAVKMTRSKPTKVAAQALVDSVLRDHRFMDDTSVIVVDVLPPGTASFPALALQAGLHPLNPERSRKAPSALCGCFHTEPEELDSRKVGDADGPGYLAFFADVDCLLEYPTLRDELLREKLIAVVPEDRTIVKDYTMHGAQVFYRQASPASRHPYSGSGAGALVPCALQARQLSHQPSVLTPRVSEEGSFTEDGSCRSNGRFLSMMQCTIEEAGVMQEEQQACYTMAAACTPQLKALSVERAG